MLLLLSPLLEVLTSSMASEATETPGSVLDLFRVPVLFQRTCVIALVK